MKSENVFFCKNPLHLILAVAWWIENVHIFGATMLVAKETIIRWGPAPRREGHFLWNTYLDLPAVDKLNVIRKGTQRCSHSHSLPVSQPILTSYDIVGSSGALTWPWRAKVRFLVFLSSLKVNEWNWRGCRSQNVGISRSWQKSRMAAVGHLEKYLFNSLAETAV